MVDENKLTEKQRRWLESSRKIGPGPMTKTERQRLEALYAEMLPSEQQELQEYIEENFGKATEHEESPIEEMARRVWREPSEKLRGALGKSQKIKPPSFRGKS